MNIQTLEKINNMTVFSESQLKAIFPEDQIDENFLENHYMDPSSMQRYSQSYFRKVFGDKYDEVIPKLQSLAGFYYILPKMFTDFRAASKTEETRFQISSEDGWMGLSEMISCGNIVNLYEQKEIFINGKTFSNLHSYGNYLIQENFFKQLEKLFGENKMKELFNFGLWKQSESQNYYKEAECNSGFNFSDIYQTEHELDAIINENKSKTDMSRLKSPEYWEQLLNRCVEDFILLNEKLSFDKIMEIRSEVLGKTVKELQICYFRNN